MQTVILYTNVFYYLLQKHMLHTLVIHALQFKVIYFKRNKKFLPSLSIHFN